MAEFSKNVDIIFRLIDQTRGSAKSIASGFSTIKQNIQSATKQVTDFKNKTVEAFNEAGLSATSLGIAMTGLGAGLTLPFAGAIKEAGNFEASMSAVKAISGSTAAEFEALEQQALKMGRETRYSAEESADALKFMSMAGLEASQSLNSLPSVLQLATAGNLDLAESADIATNVMTAYGYSADDLVMVNDRLVTAFTNSNSNLMELGTAFKYVGPIAKGLGVEFDDLVSNIAMLHNAGIKGSMAGTTLRGVLDALFNPTKAEARLMEELSDRIGGAGLQIQDASGQFIGFESLLEQLEFSGITAAEALKLFGQRAGPGMAALIEQGSGALADFNFMMGQSDGISAQIAKTMDENFNGAVKRLMSAISGLAISIGNNFLPVASAFADFLAGTINVLTEVHDALGPLATIIETVVLAFGAMVLAIGATTIAYSTFVGPVGKAINILWGIATASGTVTFSLSGLSAAFTAAAIKVKAFFAALGPIGWAIMGISAAVTGVIAVMQKYKDNSDEVIATQNELLQEYNSVLLMFDRYEAQVKRVTKYSEGWVKANKNLRTELLKIAQSESEFALKAQEAADQIDKNTGAMYDNGQTLKEFNVDVVAKDFDTLSVKVMSVAKGLSNVSAEASTWDKITGRLPYMRKSFRELSDEVESYSDIQGGLNEQQSKIQAGFNSLMQTARKTVEIMQQMGKIKISTNWVDEMDFESALSAFEDEGLNMDLAVEAMRQQYQAIAEAAKNAAQESEDSSTKSAAKIREKYINGYKDLVAGIEKNADDRILTEQKAAAELLSNDALTTAQREKISADSAKRIMAIEKAKFTQLDKSAQKYYTLLKERGGKDNEKEIKKAAQAAIQASNARREIEIEDINLVAETRRSVSDAELAEMKKQLGQQNDWARAKADEALSILNNEYSQKLISVEKYYSDKKKIIEGAQQEEMAILTAQMDAQTDSSARDDKQNEIQLKKIENARVLRDLTLEETEAKKRANEVELEAQQKLQEMQGQLDQNDPDSTYLERIRAKHQAAETELANSFDRQYQMYMDAGANEETLFALMIQKEQALLNQRKEQQRAYYEAIGSMAKRTAGQTADTFRALYEATGKKHKEFFYLMKAASIAEAIISATLGATKALANPGGYLGMALSGLIMAQGMANVAIISSQQMADGGWVAGESPNDRADNIPVWLTAKEYVMPVPVGRKYGDKIMNAFRTGMFPRGVLENILNASGASVPIAMPSYTLSGGGPVPSKAPANADQGVNIINIVDPDLFSRYTTSEEGKQSIVNVIADKAYEIKQILAN